MGIGLGVDVDATPRAHPQFGPHVGIPSVGVPPPWADVLVRRVVHHRVDPQRCFAIEVAAEVGERQVFPDGARMVT